MICNVPEQCSAKESKTRIDPRMRPERIILAFAQPVLFERRLKKPESYFFLFIGVLSLEQ